MIVKGGIPYARLLARAGEVMMPQLEAGDQADLVENQVRRLAPGGSVQNKAAQIAVRAFMRYARISRNDTSRPRPSSQSTNRTHLRLSMSVSLPVAASSG